MLRIDDLRYTYRAGGGDPLSYRYSLTLNAGEVIGILGPSGSGKSTLLDLIAGFLLPRSGTILLDGRPIEHLPPEKRPVTFLFQQHNLFEHLTAMQNLLIGLHGDTRGTPDEKARARTVLREMGIADQADKVVTALSGGQQQRVALGRALLRDRPVLLLDEPFTGLDPLTREGVLRQVRTLTRTRMLHTVMVTHDRSDCDAIADRIYRMEHGKLIEEIPADAGKKG